MLRTHYVLASLLLFSTLCHADSAAPFETKELCAHTHQIILYGENAPSLTSKELQEVCGLELIGLSLPGKQSVLKKKLYSILEAGPVTVDTIEQMKAAITSFYATNSHPFVLVKVPKQDITDGVIQLRVIESHVGTVSVVGNEWSSTSLLKKFIGIKPGDEIVQSKLLQNLYFINQSSFLQGDVIFAPGQQPYTTDITLAIKERRSVRLYAGVDNTGIESIGRNRWFMGVNWGNAFGLGHTLSYQYTASYNRNQFQGITVQYIAPLTWHHILNIYGGYSKVEPHLNIPSLKNTGWSYQTSLRYDIPLRISDSLSQDIIVGGDFKRTNNTFLFTTNAPQSGTIVNLTQVALEYKGAYIQNSYALNFNGSLFWSPGAWVGDQSNFDYRQLRTGAKHTWVYFRGGLSYLQSLPGRWSFYMLTRGQISTQNLLPSEQYGIGGFDTVRGYEEWQISADTALLGTIEIRSPRLPLIKHWCRSCNDSIQFLAFFDNGWGSNHKAPAPTFKANYIAGVGPGIRYNYSEYLTARLDVGYKLQKKRYYGGGPAMIHFSVVGSY